MATCSRCPCSGQIQKMCARDEETSPSIAPVYAGAFLFVRHGILGITLDMAKKFSTLVAFLSFCRDIPQGLDLLSRS